jgi:heme exporter protein A
MSTWIVEAENLSKTFAWMPILHGISCQIGCGEIVGVFGPNGAGKTTFLRLLATLLKPSAGRLQLFGRAPHDSAVRQRVGFLGHDSFLYPDLTPVENLTFYGRAYRVADLSTCIEAALQQSGLHDWRHTPVRTFSRGMEQRLALARALLHNPDLLLLDEPYTGLDQRGVATLQTNLTQAKERRKTVVLTTHDIALGLELCTRAFILHRGRITWQSTSGLPPIKEFLELYYLHTQHPTPNTQHPS